jgi:hypothetical protein
MTERITKRHLAGMLKRLERAAPAPEGFEWHLAAWAPGDGMTRYSLVQTRIAGGGEYEVLGRFAHCGASATYEALHALCVGLEYAAQRTQAAA